MGYFTIHLPDRKKADVRYGPVKKMKTISHRFRRRNFDEEQFGYIVKVDAGHVNERAYYFVKSNEGQWMELVGGDLSFAIKSGIERYENELTPDTLNRKKNSNKDLYAAV